MQRHIVSGKKQILAERWACLSRRPPCGWHYFMGGPWAAKRSWLLFRFVLANWNDMDAIVARGTRRLGRNAGHAGTWA